MIPVAEARRRLARAMPRPRPAAVPLAEADGLVLARDVRARFPLPPFDNAAMDGFAVRRRDLARGRALRIAGAIRAGDTRERRLAPGIAFRIMTGARLPRGTDAVIPLERARTDGRRLLAGPVPAAGAHLRRRGEEVPRGRIVLRRGAVVGPGTVSLLATLGLARVPVFRPPQVGVVGTGDELTAPGRPLRPGRIYDSNTPQLAALVRQLGLRPAFVRRAPDRAAALAGILREALGRCDVLITAGGVSGGDHDHVRAILRALGVRTIFFGVRQKPGKPMYAGRRGRTLVFGLPGNPAAAFVCFHEYVGPALRSLLGHARPGLRVRRLPLLAAVRPDPAKTLLLRARTSAAGVRPLRGQSSHMVTASARADAILVVPPGRRTLLPGRRLAVRSLP